MLEGCDNFRQVHAWQQQWWSRLKIFNHLDSHLTFFTEESWLLANVASLALSCYAATTGTPGCFLYYSRKFPLTHIIDRGIQEVRNVCPGVWGINLILRAEGQTWPLKSVWLVRHPYVHAVCPTWVCNVMLFWCDCPSLLLIAECEKVTFARGDSKLL